MSRPILPLPLCCVAVLACAGNSHAQPPKLPSDLPAGLGAATSRYVNDREQDWPAWEKDRERLPAAKYLAALRRLVATSDAEQHAQAVRWLEDLAVTRVPHAQYALFEIYGPGKFNQPRDQQKARLWLRAAAENDLPVAQWQLAWEYQDAGEAADRQAWIVQAALGGYPAAKKWIVARVYDSDLPWEEIETEVLRWAREIADADALDARAAYVAAMLLQFRALDADKPAGADAKLALRYYQQAADRKLGRAQFRLSQAYLEGFGVHADVQEAMRWLKAAAEAGHPEAMASLAEVLAVGAFGQARDMSAAEKWIARVEGSNEPIALVVAARFHETHRNDSAKAETVLRPAANAGNKEAQVELARLLVMRAVKEKADLRRHEGTIILQQLRSANYYPAFLMTGKLRAEAGNWKEAAYYYRVAAQEGSLLAAQYHLGCCYLHGRGLRKDAIEAVRWLQFAALNPVAKGSELEWASACLELARCYDAGFGVAQDRTEATRIYESLAQLGHDEAKTELKRRLSNDR